MRGDYLVNPQNVTAIILNYRGAEDTIACLQSVYALSVPPGCVLVVDNNSCDNSLKLILEAWLLLEPKVTQCTSIEAYQKKGVPLLIQHSSNGGYAAGNNVGIRCALNNEYCTGIWLLNNDAKPSRNALEALCARMITNPKAESIADNQKGLVGVVGSTIVYQRLPNKVQCAAGCSINKLLGTTRLISEGATLSEICTSDPQIVEDALCCISGASCLVRREVFENIGLLDEFYFLYYEDVAFGLRAQRAGYALAWAQQSVVMHKDGASTQANPVQQGREKWLDYIILRNRAYVMRTFFPLAVPIFCVSFLLIAIARIHRKQANRIGLVFTALFNGLLGVMGIPHFCKTKPEVNGQSR